MTDHDHLAGRRAVCRRRRCAALIAAGVLLPLPALTGCSEDDREASVAASQDIAPAPRGELKSGGTLRWAVDAMPGTLNAFQADADATTARIAGAVLPSMFTIDASGRPQRNADFLDAADVSSRDPKQVVTYKINPKARWSDGTAITAADFVAQWTALRGKSNAYWTARNAGYDRIGKVAQGANAHEVKVTFARRYADWRSLFTPLYPKSVMGSANAFNDGAREQLEVGAGPFLVQKRDAKEGRVILVRNPRWWGDPAKLKRIVLQSLPGDKRAAALAEGSVDVAAVDQIAAKRVASARRPAASGSPADGHAGPQGDGARAGARTDARAAAAETTALRGYTIRKALEPAYTQLALNGSSGPLADDRVRRAVARALDRQALADTVLKPLDLPSKPLGSHLLMAGQYGYADHSAALGDQDSGAAKALLADAGWKSDGADHQQAGEKPGAPAPDGYPDEDGEGRPDDRYAEDGYRDDSAEDGPDGSDDRNPARAARGHAGAPARGDRPAAAEAPLSFTGAVGSEVQQSALLRQSASFYKQAAASEKADADGDTESAAYAKYKRYKKRAAEALGAAEQVEIGQTGQLPGSGGHPGARHAAVERAADAAAAPQPADGKTSRIAAVKKNGKPLTLRFVLPDGAGSEQLRTVGRRIASMLGKIGVQTSLQRVSDASYFQDHIASGDYDLALYSWPGTAYPATDARPIYAKPQPAPDGSLTVEQNYTRVGTDHIDQLFDQAASELDEGASHTLVAQADARIWAAAGSIPLYQRPELVATKKSLANVGAFGFATPRFQDIGYRK
ncbi:ABC transporter family substrate-binding protein [Streptomyces lydicamycinicus]|uniref:ABC transporter family substrate-binding protein n=1 Tax=Streptomyces lydicamycinicus TaxID=1546107 RepID=UPI002035AF10|nr:ABC transporter family substrate-binding protein [Streptomyces lydicamycinicus]USA01463.1 ABC transporter family substrate-binding protein [Streptomyces lydicamycinicus]